MNILDTILEHKRDEVKIRKKACPPEQLRDMPMFGRRTLSLKQALSVAPLGVIAELKKASPSKGLIREQFDVRVLARDYVGGGARALSVLTDERFFQGCLAYLSDVRNVVEVPVLRKDFVLDEYQLLEAKAHGADAVLLIVAALSQDRLVELKARADALELETLIEIHTEAELHVLDGMDVDLIGINNRDLATFKTDLATSLRLRPILKRGVTVVSESGIASGRDLRLLQEAGVNAVLIGETFMRADRPGQALARLLKEAGIS